MISTIGIPIQIGSVTHHQLQLATGSIPINFNATKRTPSNPNTPTPELDELEFFTHYLLFFILNLDTNLRQSF